MNARAAAVLEREIKNVDAQLLNRQKEVSRYTARIAELTEEIKDLDATLSALHSAVRS